MFFSSQNWAPGFHDPTLAAWVLVVGYVSVAFLCLCAARREEKGDRADALIWLGLGVLILAIGINKELDLHALLFEKVGAAIAHWELNRQRSLIEIVGVASGMVVIVVSVSWFLWRFQPSPRLCIASLLFSFLLLVLVAQAISINRLALWLQSAVFDHQSEWMSVEVSEVFEGLLLIAIGWVALRSSRAPAEFK